MLLFLKSHVAAYRRKTGQVAGHERRPMYCSRKVLNGADIHKWATGQGFKNVTPPDKMHVTVAYSRAAVDHEAIKPDTNEVVGKAKHLDRLGSDPDDMAHVLRIDHPTLHARFQHMRAHGASWDHDDEGYNPHVTISYAPDQDVDHADVQPYTGPVHLGPEKVEDLKSGWGKKVAAAETVAKALFIRRS